MDQFQDYKSSPVVNKKSDIEREWSESSAVKEEELS
jgi:hypothetical protein